MHSHSRCRKATDSVSVRGGQLAAIHRQKGVLLCVAAGSGAAGAAHCGGHDGRFYVNYTSLCSSTLDCLHPYDDRAAFILALQSTPFLTLHLRKGYSGEE